MERAKVLDFELQKQLVPYMKDIVPLPGVRNKTPRLAGSSRLFPAAEWQLPPPALQASSKRYSTAQRRPQQRQRCLLQQQWQYSRGGSRCIRGVTSSCSMTVGIWQYAILDDEQPGHGAAMTCRRELANLIEIRHMSFMSNGWAEI